MRKVLMSLTEINKTLLIKPFLEGYEPSKADAELFHKLFGANTRVATWAARMASYFEVEREEIKQNSGKTTTQEEIKEAVQDSKASDAETKDESDFDLFEEGTKEEKEALEAQRAKEQEKRKKKIVVTSKSNIILDIKPFDDSTDLAHVAKKIRDISKDGLVWGVHQLLPIAFGLQKLRFSVVIEDEKIASDDLEDTIMQLEDEIQSMDIVSWTRV